MTTQHTPNIVLVMVATITVAAMPVPRGVQRIGANCGVEGGREDTDVDGGARGGRAGDRRRDRGSTGITGNNDNNWRCYVSLIRCNQHSKSQLTASSLKSVIINHIHAHIFISSSVRHNLLVQFREIVPCRYMHVGCKRPKLLRHCCCVVGKTASAEQYPLLQAPTCIQNSTRGVGSYYYLVIIPSPGNLRTNR